MDVTPPQSIGLAGDGDELEALRDVEAAFGVKLDYADSGNWVTAGSLFESLRRAMRAGPAENPETWARFTHALAQQAGVKPASVKPNSPLLAPELGRWTRAVWLIGVVAALAARIAWIRGSAS